MTNTGYKREFIDFALRHEVLRFGSFTLKSGRQSPYFFNAGLFNTGERLAGLGRYYAAAIVDSGLTFDVLLGPAYKGIPIASATAVQLWERHGVDAPWAFNRKEAKDHGEGGLIVGTPLSGRVLVVDDVITSGAAIREVMAVVDAAPQAQLAGVLVSVDRQERGTGTTSAVQEVEREYGAPVRAIVTLDDIVGYLQAAGSSADLDAMLAYRAEYGV